MKRTLMTLALMAAAGTASAQTVTTPPVGGAAVTSPSVGSGTVMTPAVNPPAVSTSAVPARTMGAAPTTANAPPLPNAAGSAKAQAKIKADGYANVQGLTRNRDGSWSGKAMRGTTMVDVGVDARGNVITK